MADGTLSVTDLRFFDWENPLNQRWSVDKGRGAFYFYGVAGSRLNIARWKSRDRYKEV